jgi:hypothetical protein
VTAVTFVNGHAATVGTEVLGWSVDAITAAGAVLGADGRRIFLPVGRAVTVR